MRYLILVLLILANVICQAQSVKIDKDYWASEISDKFEFKIKSYEAEVSFQNFTAITRVCFEAEVFTTEYRGYEGKNGKLDIKLNDNQFLLMVETQINDNMIRGAIGAKISPIYTDWVNNSTLYDPLMTDMANSKIISATFCEPPHYKKKVYKIAMTIAEDFFPVGNILNYKLPFYFADTCKNFTIKFNINNDHKYDSIPLNPDLCNIRYNTAIIDTNTIYPDYTYQIPYSNYGKDAFCENYKGETYFKSMISMPLNKKKSLPKNIAIVYDVSMSNKKKNIKAEQDILRKYFNINKNCNVALVPFSVVKEKEINYHIKNGNCTKLIDDIGNMIYDGTTDYSLIDIRNRKFDEVFFFSDGDDKLGNNHILTDKVPIYTFSSKDSSNKDLLSALAVDGMYFDLIKDSAENILKALSSDCNFKKRIVPDENIDSLIISKYCREKNNILLLGKLKSDSGKIKIDNRTINVQKKDTANYSELVHKLWANRRAAELMTDYFKNKREILTLSDNHQVLTPYTAFFVFDDIGMYEYRKITPPSELNSDIKYDIIENLSRYKHSHKYDSIQKNKDKIKMIEETSKIIKSYNNSKSSKFTYSKKMLNELNQHCPNFQLWMLFEFFKDDNLKEKILILKNTDKFSKSLYYKSYEIENIDKSPVILLDSQAKYRTYKLNSDKANVIVNSRTKSETFEIDLNKEHINIFTLPYNPALDDSIVKAERQYLLSHNGSLNCRITDSDTSNNYPYYCSISRADYKQSFKLFTNQVIQFDTLLCGKYELSMWGPWLNSVEQIEIKPYNICYINKGINKSKKDIDTNKNKRINITGKVFFADNNEPAMNACIKILGTNKGAKVKSDGKYAVMGIPMFKWSEVIISVIHEKCNSDTIFFNFNDIENNSTYEIPTIYLKKSTKYDCDGFSWGEPMPDYYKYYDFRKDTVCAYTTDDYYKNNDCGSISLLTDYFDKNIDKLDTNALLKIITNLYELNNSSFVYEQIWIRLLQLGRYDICRKMISNTYDNEPSGAIWALSRLDDIDNKYEFEAYNIDSTICNYITGEDLFRINRIANRHQDSSYIKKIQEPLRADLSLDLKIEYEAVNFYKEFKDTEIQLIDPLRLKYPNLDFGNMNTYNNFEINYYGYRLVKAEKGHYKLIYKAKDCRVKRKPIFIRLKLFKNYGRADETLTEKIVRIDKDEREKLLIEFDY